MFHYLAASGVVGIFTRPAHGGELRHRALRGGARAKDSAWDADPQRPLSRVAVSVDVCRLLERASAGMTARQGRVYQQLPCGWSARLLTSSRRGSAAAMSIGVEAASGLFWAACFFANAMALVAVAQVSCKEQNATTEAR